MLGAGRMGKEGVGGEEDCGCLVSISSRNPEEAGAWRLRPRLLF